MSEISTWPNQANDFNALPVPDSAPELGVTIAQLNDVIRELQASVRREYEAREWRSFNYLITSNSSNTIDFGEAIPLFVAGQRIKVTDNTSGVLYGTIDSNVGQTLTISVDAGANLTTVAEVAFSFSPVGLPIDYKAISNTPQIFDPVSSSPITFDSTPRTYTFTHTLGRVPLIVQLQATCLINDGDYVVNDVIEVISNQTVSSDFTFYNMTTTTATMTNRGGLRVTSKDSLTLLDLTANSWALRAVVL